jgi:hypothetical protein
MIVLDPPVQIDQQAIGLQAIGVKMIERNGVYHLLDWVGTNHYPNVADFVEEAARWGISRRMPSNLRFDLLTPHIRLLLVHEKAYLDRRGGLIGSPQRCPTGIMNHQHGEAGSVPMCVRYWWDDLDADTGTLTRQGSMEVTRALAGGLSYVGRRRAAPLDNVPFRQPAIFASIKLGFLAVIRDRENQTHRPHCDRLLEQGVTYQLVNE